MIAAVTVWEWLAFAIFLGFAVGATLRLPRFWRGDISVMPRMRSWWPFGDALMRGYERGIPAATVGCWLAVLAFVTGWLATVGKRTGSEALHGLAYATVAAAGGMLLAFCVMGTVALFNRPKFVVAPHLRDQPGAVQEWYRASRRRWARKP